MKYIADKSALILNESSVLHGESVFTSCLEYNGKFLFIEDHLERLAKGIQFLFADSVNAKQFNLIKQNKNCSIRINYSREGCWINYRNHELFKSELITAKSIQLQGPNLIKPDYLKLSDYALIKAELMKRPVLDDLLLFDAQDRLTEASTSNVFIVGLNQKIYTPKTSSMVLDGIYRKNLIQFFKINDFEIIEGDVFFDDVLKSSEILLTNSIKGIRRVLQFEKNIYNNKNVFDFVINKFGQFGEKFYE